MDAARFDRLVRGLSARVPRRTAVGLMGLSALGVSREAGAKKKKKRIKRNEFGCVDVGKICKNDGQCCSGVCKGKKDKKKCQDHDQSTCQKGQDICLGAEVDCTTTTGAIGDCITTTGKGSYCFARNSAECFACARDADCVPLFGEGAACVVCTTECADQVPNGTVCAGRNAPQPT